MKENISLTVIDRDGVEHALEAPTDMGLNLMEVCRLYELPVEGICGGMALCASCHVYVLSDHSLPHVSDEEEEMLDSAFFVEDNSRLSCQIKVSENINEIKVALAPVGE